MSKFTLISKRRPSWHSLKKYWPLIIVLVLVLSQVERFVRVGTIFGYAVRSTQSAESATVKNRSGSIINGRVSADNKKSIACDLFPENKVKDILKTDVERISGFVPDSVGVTTTSSCIYRTKADAQNRRTISLLYREFKDQATSKKTLESLRKSNKGSDVKKLGNEAYFNESANQLTMRQDKKVYTITVPGTANQKSNSKDTAIQIAKIVL